MAPAARSKRQSHPPGAFPPQSAQKAASREEEKAQKRQRTTKRRKRQRMKVGAVFLLCLGSPADRLRALFVIVCHATGARASGEVEGKRERESGRRCKTGREEKRRPAERHRLWRETAPFVCGLF